MELERSEGGTMLALFTATTVFIVNNCVCLPLYVFFSNGQDFSTPPSIIVGGLLGASLVASILATLGLSTLPNSWRESLVAFLIGLTLITYVQGYLLVGDYGVLDGSDVELKSLVAFTAFEIPFWLGISVSALWQRRRLVENQFFLSLLLVGIQVAGVVAVSTRWESPVDFSIRVDSSGKFSLSQDRNIVMLVMDGFQADIFQELISEDEAAKQELRGFTFYRNYLAGYSKTAGAIPLMLTGEVYTNDVPYAAYVHQEFHDHSVPMRLVESGWNVELYPLLRNMVALSPETASNVFRENDFGHAVAEIGQLAQVAAFRSVPHFLKTNILQSDFLLGGGFGGFLRSSLESTEESRRTHEEFVHPVLEFKESMKMDGKVEDGAPRFRFYHLLMPHEPFSLDRDLNFKLMNEQGFRGYLEYSRAAIRVLRDVVRQLKDLGTYDRTTLIVLSDHGGGEYYDGTLSDVLADFNRGEELLLPVSQFVAGLALLLVKGEGSQAPFSTSDDPVAAVDIAEWVLGIAADPRTALVPPKDSSPPEKRKFRFYKWAPAARYLPSMRTYEVDGHAWSFAAWRETKEVLKSPDELLGASEPLIELGEILQVGYERTTPRSILAKGWNAAEATGVWSKARSVIDLKVEGLSAGTDLWLSLQGRPYLARGEIQSQTATLSVGEDFTATFVLDARSTGIDAHIPARALGLGAEFSVVLEMPGAERPLDRKLSMDSRRLGFFLTGIGVDRVPQVVCAEDVPLGPYRLTEHFYKSEPWGKWIRGSHGKLYFFVEDGCKPQELKVGVVASVSLHNPRVTGEFRLNGHAVGSLEINHGGSPTRRELSMNVSTRLVSGLNVLEINVDGAHVPAETGDSSDGRKFGLGLTRFRLD